MSKIKLLIHEVFEQGKRESGKQSKSGVAFYLNLYFIDNLNYYDISDKTFVRYYDDYIQGKGERNIEPDRLDKMSQYVGYQNFSDFSRTFIKKEDDANKTTVKISVDENDTSLTDKIINIFITNEQNFKMPEFMKQNGFGIVELVFVLLLITGTSGWGSGKFGKNENMMRLSFFGGDEIAKEKECMYWTGEEYKVAYCDDRNPQRTIIPLDTIQLKYLKRIERKDTLTVENAFGKVWYSKYNGVVEFFTDDGVDPNNGRELRKATEYIIDKYAGVIEEEVEQ